MRIDRAIRTAMIFSGKYDTGKKLKVTGVDAWSNHVEEEIDEVDMERLERDLVEMKRLRD